MRDYTIKDKVKIFISSRIDNRYTIVRKSLKLLLEETNMCEVFIFDESNASTQNVVDYYMNKIDDIDICIFIIDNKDKVSDPVLQEQKRAIELKKKGNLFFL